MPLDAARAIGFANVVGTHALTVFGVALVVLLLVVGSAWLIVHRLYVRRQSAPDLADARALTATLLLGIVAIVSASLVFAILPQGLLPNHPLALADRALTDAIRLTVSLSTLQVFAALTVLANTPVQWAVAIVGALILLWRRDYFLATFWIAAIAGNGTLTRALKAIFERARPLRDHDLFAVQGWSFPSGHASGAVAIYGALAYVLIRCTPTAWHLPIVLGATAIAFTTGCSRIFLQVHYATDVLAGFASGLAWLSVCVISAEVVARHRRRTGGDAVHSVRAEQR